MSSLHAAAKPAYIHATAVTIESAGLLIRGPSRAGKSSLALALLAEAERMGCYGRLIGDDRISIENRGGALMLRGHPAIAGKIEQRGKGILDVAWISQGQARYVIDLPAASASEETFAAGITQIQGILLPLFRLPFGPTAEERARFILFLISRYES